MEGDHICSVERKGRKKVTGRSEGWWSEDV